METHVASGITAYTSQPRLTSSNSCCQIGFRFILRSSSPHPSPLPSAPSTPLFSGLDRLRLSKHLFCLHFYLTPLPTRLLLLRFLILRVPRTYPLSRDEVVKAPTRALAMRRVLSVELLTSGFLNSGALWKVVGRMSYHTLP
jgi:hypothetical protein